MMERLFYLFVTGASIIAYISLLMDIILGVPWDGYFYFNAFIGVFCTPINLYSYFNSDYIDEELIMLNLKLVYYKFRIGFKKLLVKILGKTYVCQAILIDVVDGEQRTFITEYAYRTLPRLNLKTLKQTIFNGIIKQAPMFAKSSPDRIIITALCRL